jgi:predicted RNase H-like HicB family nuclease
MSKARKRIEVLFEPDVDGWWVVTVPAVQGCRTSAPTIERGKKYIREAYAAATGDDRTARTADLVIDIRLPEKPRQTLRLATQAREQAKELQGRAASLMSDVARTLLDSGISTRDAAVILGLSRQRVQQLAAAS